MIAKMTETKDKVLTFAEKTTDKVESFHKKMANKPFEMLEKVKVTGPNVDKVKDFQNKSIDKLYTVVRKTNKKAGELATDLLGKVSKKEASVA